VFLFYHYERIFALSTIGLNVAFTYHEVKFLRRKRFVPNKSDKKYKFNERKLIPSEIMSIMENFLFIIFSFAPFMD
jgi:hypothetical protein